MSHIQLGVKTILFATLLLISGIGALFIPSENRSNCFLYAIMRWKTVGGHLVIHNSRFGWWPHCWWTQDYITFEEYIPLADNYPILIRRARRFRIPPILFIGHVRTWTL